MKGHHAEFEADSRDDKPDSGREQGEARSSERDFPDAQKLHRPDIRVDEGHAEKEECGGRGSQNQVLDSRFERLISIFQIRDEGIQRDAQDLESEKEGNKVSARHQDRTPCSRDQEQHI